MFSFFIISNPLNSKVPLGLNYFIGVAFYSEAFIAEGKGIYRRSLLSFSNFQLSIDI